MSHSVPGRFTALTLTIHSFLSSAIERVLVGAGGGLFVFVLVKVVLKIRLIEFVFSTCIYRKLFPL